MPAKSRLHFCKILLGQLFVPGDEVQPEKGGAHLLLSSRKATFVKLLGHGSHSEPGYQFRNLVSITISKVSQRLAYIRDYIVT